MPNHARAEPGLAETPASFATSFPPEIELVPAVRRFVSNFYTGVLGDGEASARVALATHELLENAIAYCSHGGVTVRVSVSPFRSKFMVRVRTRNAATFANIERVKAILDRMREADTPAAFYARRMMETVVVSDGSGLGLPRIHAEADMEITCTVTGDELEIAAQTLLEMDP